MAILEIVKDTDEILRKKSREVTQIDQRTLQLLDDMHDTLTKADGAGLAAVQVGVLRRIVLVYVDDEKLELINPEILSCKGNQESIEGCLSCPGKWAITNRPMTVKIRYTDRHGEQHVRKASGLMAKAFCHEIDHLDGKLFYDENVVKMLTEKELEEMIG